MQPATHHPPRTLTLRRTLLVALMALGALVFPHASTSPVTAQADSDLIADHDALSGSASAYRAINPIRVLHEAVSLAGIGETGPALPLLSQLDEADAPRVGEAAKALLGWS